MGIHLLPRALFVLSVLSVLSVLFDLRVLRVLRGLYHCHFVMDHEPLFLIPFMAHSNYAVTPCLCLTLAPTVANQCRQDDIQRVSGLPPPSSPIGLFELPWLPLDAG